MLSAANEPIMLSVIRSSVVMLSVILLSVVMLSAIMLNVVVKLFAAVLSALRHLA